PRRPWHEYRYVPPLTARRRAVDRGKGADSQRWETAPFFVSGRVRAGGCVNKIEEIKNERDGLEIGADIARFAELGHEAIGDGDRERLKWWGTFFRKHTPGHFMMRIRIP